MGYDILGGKKSLENHMFLPPCQRIGKALTHYLEVNEVEPSEVLREEETERRRQRQEEEQTQRQREGELGIESGISKSIPGLLI